MGREIVIGIDPGAKGYACVYHARLNEYTHIALTDDARLKAMLHSVRDANAVACIERVRALKGAGSNTTFSFGYNCGWIHGVLDAYGIPTVTVTPQKWQREMWESTDRVTVDGKVHTKKTSERAAKRLHPTLDFRRTEKCTKPDDNKVDATLICDYAKRKNL